MGFPDGYWWQLFHSYEFYFREFVELFYHVSAKKYGLEQTEPEQYATKEKKSRIKKEFQVLKIKGNYWLFMCL